MGVNATTEPTAINTKCCLCSLPVRSPVYDTDEKHSKVFCCSGCRNVWRILVESGQLSDSSDPRDTDLFRRALEAGIIGVPPDSSPLQATQINADITQERKGSALDDNRQCILQIDGMWCSSCAWLIGQTLLRKRGVVSAEVSFASDTGGLQAGEDG